MKLPIPTSILKRVLSSSTTLENLDMKINNNDHKINDRVDRLESIIDKSSSELAKSIAKFERSMSNEFVNVNEKITTMDEKITTMNEKFTKEFIQIEKAVQSVRHITSEMSAGMGIKFEKFNASWVRHILEERGVSPVAIQFGRKEADFSNLINPGSSEFEIDIYSINPFLIGEATTFLKETEFEKVVKLVRVRDLLTARHQKSPEVYFFCLALHSKIASKVRLFCKENKIHLITQYED